MAQKLLEKSVQVNKDIERFTVGRDREMDLYLAKHDVLGSMAHITMLESIWRMEGWRNRYRSRRVGRWSRHIYKCIRLRPSLILFD